MMVASITPTTCPGCESRTAELTPAGVCLKCKTQFAREHTHHVERPPRWEARDFEYHTHGAPSGFDEHGRCGVVEETHVEPEALTVRDIARQDAAHAMHRVLSWCWDNGLRPLSLTTAFRKFCAASAVLNPDWIGGKSYLEIAKELRCSKALISRHAVHFSDVFGMKFRRSRPLVSRQRMAQAARGHAPNRKGQRKTPK
jgi:hypothetical protein